MNVPICNYCNKEKVIVFKSPLGEANRNGGRFWKFTCSNKECQVKHNSKIQKKFTKIMKKQEKYTENSELNI